MKYYDKVTLDDATTLELSYDEANDWLYADWQGYLNEEGAKKSALAVIKGIKETGTTKVLNDNRNQTGPWPPIDQWLAEVFIPGLKEAGLQYFAYIHSPSVFTQMSASKFANQIINEIEFDHFKDETEARQWLKSKN